LPFEIINTVNSYDETTLFCPAGMQKYKKEFKDISKTNTTICNIQSCLRLNDLDSLGDGIHLGNFQMMGMFSFRHWSVPQTIDFWMEFLTKELQLKIDYTTVHPDKKDWEKYHTVPIKYDEECKWSDGDIGGYCTEFYINNIEIGNIVNPLENCIDVGFGLERLEFILTGNRPLSIEDSLENTILKIIESGVFPSHTKQGYILRKLMRLLYKKGGKMSHPLFLKEVERQLKMKDNYIKLFPKYKEKNKDWWYETHGISLDEINS
jgi:alanyl-tRNA synthetase